MIKLVINDKQGLVQQTSESGGCLGIKQSRSAEGTFVAATNTIISPSITIPKDSVITAFHVVITDGITSGEAGNMGVKFGVTGDDDKFMALSADSFHAVGDAENDLAKGNGNSTSIALSAALDIAGNNTALTAVAGTMHLEADTEIFGTIVRTNAVPAAVPLTAGKARFLIEFITLS
jgi:hypothetical protein